MLVETRLTEETIYMFSHGGSVAPPVTPPSSSSLTPPPPSSFSSSCQCVRHPSLLQRLAAGVFLWVSSSMEHNGLWVHIIHIRKVTGLQSWFQMNVDMPSERRANQLNCAVGLYHELTLNQPVMVISDLFFHPTVPTAVTQSCPAPWGSVRCEPTLHLFHFLLGCSHGMMMTQRNLNMRLVSFIKHNPSEPIYFASAGGNK